MIIWDIPLQGISLQTPLIIGGASACLVLLLVYRLEIYGFLSFVSNTTLPWKNMTADYQYLSQNKSTTSPSINLSIPSCSPVVNIVFIKVHKAGSTTMANIFLRYAYKNNLSVAVPAGADKVWLGWPGQISRNRIMPPYPGSGRKEEYNILAHHSVYNEQLMGKIMPMDSMYTAIIRQPYEHFLSSFRYLHVAAKLNIKSEDPLAEFLKDPNKYEKLDREYGFPVSLTKNTMAYDMGIAPKMYNNKTFLSNYITHLDTRFRLVLILEYLEESVILLKRFMCWTLEDVIYSKVLPMGDDGTHRLTEHTALLRKQLHKWSAADYMLYDYFNKTLWRKIGQETDDFAAEVVHLKETLALVVSHCENATTATSHLLIPRSKWTDQFYVTLSVCRTLKITDLEFTDLFRARNQNYQKTHGEGKQ